MVDDVELPDDEAPKVPDLTDIADWPVEDETGEPDDVDSEAAE